MALQVHTQHRVDGRVLNLALPPQLDVQSIQGFSAHAGQDLLVRYALGLKDRVQDVFLVHGEERGALPLIDQLKANGLDHVHFPPRNHLFYC